MNITSALYRIARLSRDLNAVQKGPTAVGKRAVRKVAYKQTAKALRWLLK